MFQCIMLSAMFIPVSYDVCLSVFLVYLLAVMSVCLFLLHTC